MFQCCLWSRVTMQTAHFLSFSMWFLFDCSYYTGNRFYYTYIVPRSMLVFASLSFLIARMCVPMYLLFERMDTRKPENSLVEVKSKHWMHCYSNTFTNTKFILVAVSFVVVSLAKILWSQCQTEVTHTHSLARVMGNADAEYLSIFGRSSLHLTHSRSTPYFVCLHLLWLFSTGTVCCVALMYLMRSITYEKAISLHHKSQIACNYDAAFVMSA